MLESLHSGRLLNLKIMKKLALIIVNRDLAVNTKSTAEAYEGIIIGAKKTKDLMERVRERAITGAFS